MPAASFGSLSQLPGNSDCGIKDVWNRNLHEEFQIIRQVIKKNKLIPFYIFYSTVPFYIIVPNNRY